LNNIAAVHDKQGNYVEAILGECFFEYLFAGVTSAPFNTFFVYHNWCECCEFSLNALSYFYSHHINIIVSPRTQCTTKGWTWPEKCVGRTTRSSPSPCATSPPSTNDKVCSKQRFLFRLRSIFRFLCSTIIPCAVIFLDILFSFHLFFVTCVLYFAGNCVEAFSKYGESLEVMRRVYGPEHPSIADTLKSQASVHEMLGEKPWHFDSFHSYDFIFCAMICGVLICFLHALC